MARPRRDLAAIPTPLALPPAIALSSPRPRSPRATPPFPRHPRVTPRSLAPSQLVRPSAELYAEGLATLRRCRYNRTHGWDLTGAAARLGVVPTRLGGARVRPPLSATDARLADWAFVGADQDQGLLFYLLFVRHRAGAYGAGGYERARRAGLPLSRHWWAGFEAG